MSKIILSSDWHEGEKDNSTQHHDDLSEFTEFMIAYAKEHNIKKFKHLGDFFHQRDKLNVATINHGIEIVNRLNEQFGEFTMLKGNHDLYFRDNRDVSSLEMFRDQVNLVDYYQIDGDCMYVSWVTTAEEYDEIVNISKKNKIRFMFGHFEFSSFKMNDHYIMEHGQTHNSLKHIEKVYTGHYHMQQEVDNVQYLGSPFQFNYNDANDFNRGFWVLDTETGEDEFVLFDKVHIMSVNHRDLLENDFSGIDNLSLRVVIDEDINDETLLLIKEKMDNENFRDTKVVYKINKTKEAIEEETVIDNLLGVDDSVIEHINQMTEVKTLDKTLLVDLYNQAKEEA